MSIRNHRYYWWIFLASMLLTINAGFVNVFSLMGVSQKPASYMTGNVVKIGVGLHNRDFPLMFEYATMIFAFLLGAVANGIIIRSDRFSLHNHYGRALIYQSMLLFIAWYVLKRPMLGLEQTGEYAIAMACGMQNSIATMFSGAIIRTTHMTGILTDLGIEIGHLLRKSNVQIWRIKFFMCSLFSFIVGTYFGFKCYDTWNQNALLYSIISCFMVGFLLILVRTGLARNMKDA